jgi:hypothetical protein
VHLMAGLPNPWVRDDVGRTFREWLGPTWAECVWHEILAPLLGKRWAGTRTSVEQMAALETVMPGAGGAYLRHATYGTRVGTRERRGRITDPKRAAEYFLKEGIASSKAYQDNPPAQWVENGAGTGRIWQVWGLKEDTVTVAMTPADGIAFGRLMRRWYRAQLAVAYQRPRHAGGGRRFRPLFTNNRGRVLVNNGAAFTAQAARWLASRDAVGSPNPPIGTADGSCTSRWRASGGGTTTGTARARTAPVTGSITPWRRGSRRSPDVTRTSAWWALGSLRAWTRVP